MFKSKNLFFPWIFLVGACSSPAVSPEASPAAAAPLLTLGHKLMEASSRSTCGKRACALITFLAALGAVAGGITLGILSHKDANKFIVEALKIILYSKEEEIKPKLEELNRRMSRFILKIGFDPSVIKTNIDLLILTLGKGGEVKIQDHILKAEKEDLNALLVKLINSDGSRASYIRDCPLLAAYLKTILEALKNQSPDIKIDEALSKALADSSVSVLYSKIS